MQSTAAKIKGLSWLVAALVLLAIAWVMPAPCKAAIVAGAETRVRGSSEILDNCDRAEGIQDLGMQREIESSGLRTVVGCCHATRGGANLLGQSFGRLGTVIKNPGLTIRGFEGSVTPGHAINQIITRGVTPQILQSTVQNPAVVLQQAGGRYLYLSGEAAVVMTGEGQVVTSWGRAQFMSHIWDVLKAAGVP